MERMFGNKSQGNELWEGTTGKERGRHSILGMELRNSARKRAGNLWESLGRNS